MSGFIQTYTGKIIYNKNLGQNDICIEDIARSLSNKCRFGGHCKFYSVAQHSILVSKLVTPDLAMQALLHDAAEAYICDVPRPWKKLLPLIIQTEEMYLKAIMKKFAQPWPIADAVWNADDAILHTEAMALFGDVEHWCLKIEPAIIDIVPLSPKKSERAFLARYRELSK